MEHDPVHELGRRIQAHASDGTRRWWERYLRGAAAFRGVPMARVRTELHRWYRDHDLAARDHAARAGLAIALIRQPMTEDKLAGILFFQEILIPLGAPSWDALLPAFESLFVDGHLADWNAVDWFCVKTLGPLIERDGEPCARAIAGWRTAPVLWQRRASAVAFVNLLGPPERFPGLYDEVVASCAALVAGEERFSQTGAGWVLRRLGEADPDRTVAFLRSHADRMSREALLNATKKLPPETRDALRSRELPRTGGRD